LPRYWVSFQEIIRRHPFIRSDNDWSFEGKGQHTLKHSDVAFVSVQPLGIFQTICRFGSTFTCGTVSADVLNGCNQNPGRSAGKKTDLGQLHHIVLNAGLMHDKSVLQGSATLTVRARSTLCARTAKKT